MHVKGYTTTSQWGCGQQDMGSMVCLMFDTQCLELAIRQRQGIYEMVNNFIAFSAVYDDAFRTHILCNRLFDQCSLSVQMISELLSGQR